MSYIRQRTCHSVLCIKIPPFAIDRPPRFPRRAGGRPAMNLIALNKPFGTICQFSAHETRPSLGDWVKTPGVYAAGRLDADSEGCCCSPTTVRCRRASPSRATSSSSATGRRSRRARPRRPEGARARRRPRRLRDASMPRRVHRAARHAAAQSADPLPRRDPDDMDRACDHRGQEPAGAPDDGGRRLPDVALVRVGIGALDIFALGIAPGETIALPPRAPWEGFAPAG